MAFPDDGMRFQEEEQRFTIDAGKGRVCHLSIREFAAYTGPRCTRLGSRNDGNQIRFYSGSEGDYRESRSTEIPIDQGRGLSIRARTLWSGSVNGYVPSLTGPHALRGPFLFAIHIIKR